MVGQQREPGVGYVHRRNHCSERAGIWGPLDPKATGWTDVATARRTDLRQRPVPFITRVQLRNYKSIAECDVRLGPLTVLVGPNGAGKSNFIDALAFAGEAVATTPYQAIDARGGLREILRRVPGPTESFSVALEVAVPWGPDPEQWARGSYEFEVAPGEFDRQRPFEVVHEQCALRWGGQAWRFRVERGAVEDETLTTAVPAIEPDRLYLQTASVQTTFAPLFAGLRRMQFYRFDLDVLRRPHPQTVGSVLGRRGEHLGDVLGALDADDRGYKRRIDAYLSAAVPEIEGIDRYFAGNYVTVALRAKTGAGGRDVEFGPEAISDGTIRAAGVLAALFQPWVLDGRVRLVGIEEPEIALHPAAAGVLFDALTEASQRVQVVATSQSPDLLDRDDFDVSTVRAVTMEHGLTIIGEVDEASREIAAKKLYTLGELMRSNQLSPDRTRHGDAASAEA